MALFGKKKSPEEALEMAKKIAEGRGVTGRIAGGFMGQAARAQLGDALGSIDAAQHQAAATAAAAAAGAAMTPATVTGLADTGKLINFDPVVVLSLTIVATGQPVQLETLVSKLQIPRVGDTALLMADPSSGGYLYAGLQPAG